MKAVSVNKLVLRLAPLALAVSCSLSLLAGCSSGSSDSIVGSTDASISGTIVAAPVNGANVSVVDASGNPVAEPVPTDAAGLYTLSIPNDSLAQDLMIISTGGTFTDEATGNKDVPAGEMMAYASANSLSNGSSVSATPGSTIIANLVMKHGKTRAEAEAAFASAFGYAPDMSVTPADATTAPATDETDAETLAGFRAGAFSQLAMDLGLSQNDQFDLFAALAQDLSDDKLDGVDASGAVDIGNTGFVLEADIQNRFNTAMVNFLASNNNKTGLNNAQIGNLPFAKVALTATYKIEYKQIGTMDAMDGKNTFQLHITDRLSGNNVTGKVPMLMPMMHMALMNHSTPMPVPAVTEVGGGLYNVTLYYLMASQMMDGTSMGFWDLEFTVAAEKAHLYPTVMMAMPGMLQVRLKGVDDIVMVMDPVTETMIMVSRPYFIFKDDLAAGSDMDLYNFSVFVAARETMMKFPAIYVGNTLSGQIISDARVEMSVDDGATWIVATDGLNGVWNVTDLPLTSGQANEIRIKLWVDHNSVAEYKTTNGFVLDTTNTPPTNADYQTFTVTPGMSM